MTDEADSRVEGGTEGDAAVDSDASPDPEAGSPSNVDARAEFGDLSLPQRVFVAAVQNPTRGVVIVGLFAFAFSFYVALWMVFPRVAAFLSVIGVVLAALVALVYALSARLSR
ncbi:hypothetical protein [Halorubrum sp. DTA46]|uniref:hypothetical protein n=1 Tax=Halorubrum sp. DTA46 TaxID=3402162 RepID=UPI003AB0C7BA